MSPKLKFADGERVLCFHGPLIYEAKLLKSAITKDKQIKYYIHYAGWNKNWDEWVPENRVLKYNEVNVQRQLELNKQQPRKTKKATGKGRKSDIGLTTLKDGDASSGGSESRASSPSKEQQNTSVLLAPSPATPISIRGNRTKLSNTPSIPISKESVVHEVAAKDDASAKDDSSKEETQKKKRGGSHVSDRASTSAASTVATTANTYVSTSASTTPTPATRASSSSRDTNIERDDLFTSKAEVCIKMPDELKQCLADDWDAVTRQHKLLDIPARPTVQDIVDQYNVFKKTSKVANVSKDVSITDVLNGIVEYFNVMLGSQLLYKFERPQYAEILQQHPETPFSKLYGAFHLLRLFVRLGNMLSYSALDEKSLQTLLAHLNDFLKFMVKNSSTYFSMASFVNVSPEYHRNTQ